MFGKRHKDNGEKVFRYSIRKYHFGAASVAVAALMFFANGVQAQAPAVSSATASDVVAGPSGNSDGDPQDSDEESPEKTAVVEQPVDLKSAGGSSAPEAKTEEGSREESEAEVKSPQPETKIDENAEAPKVAEEKDQEVSAPVADTSAAKSIQSTLEALLANLTLDSMKALHTEVEEALAKAKAVLENPKATQAQVDEQVKLMEDLTRRVKEALSPQVSTPPVLEKAGLTNTRLAAPEGTVLTPKEAVTKVLEKNPVASTNGEVRTPSTKLSKSEVSDNQNKEKLKTMSKDLSAYLIRANEITRPETKKLLEGVEEIVKSIEASVSQPQLTPAEIEELLKKGKQAEKKLALALTREKSGKRDLLTGKTMKTGSDFRASSATEDLNTIRAYIAKGGTVTTRTGYTFTLPKETYLYSMNRSTNPNYPFTNRTQADVGEALDEASITVKKDDSDTTGKKFIWEVTFNNSNLSHQNAYYWFTLPKGHTIGELLAATRTSNGNRSYGTSHFDAEWGGKIKEHLSVNKAVFGSAKNYHFDDTVDSITDLTNVDYIAGSKQRSANNEGNRFKEDGRGFYYLGKLYRPNTIFKDGRDKGISDSVIDKAEKNLEGLKDNTEKLYLMKYDGSGPIRLRYTTTTDNKYAPLYYAAGMRSYEYSSAKHYFMARGLQETPNAPTVKPNNEGTVTVTPYPDNDKNKNVDKVELSYTNASGANKTVTLIRNAQNGTWTSSGDGADGIQIKGNSFSLKAGSVQVGTKVTAKSFFGNSDASAEGSEKIRQRTAAPNVTANQDGSVTVTPNGNADYLTVKYTEENTRQNKEITANKQGSTWTVSGGTNVTIHPSSGTITIPANSVEDSSTVEAQAQAKAADEFISEKATAKVKDQDRTAPTIRVRKNGTTTWLTPKDGVVTVVATPNNNGEVNLDVNIEDNSGGSGYTFNSRPGDSQTAKYDGEGYEKTQSIFTAGYGKASDATALLKLKLPNVEGRVATEVPSTGVTVNLNAKDNDGNWTSQANGKQITLKIVSPKPTYPAKTQVQNPDNYTENDKDRVIAALKEANKKHPAGAPTFTKGTGTHANEILTTYPDGTTYYVPLDDVTSYTIVPKFPKTTKYLTLVSGEQANSNWGNSKNYFTYADGSAISDRRWSPDLDSITQPFRNADITVGDNKTITVTGPDGNGSSKQYTIDYRVVAPVTPKNSMYTVKGKDFVKPNTTTAAVASDFYNNTEGKTIAWKAGSEPNKNAVAGQNHTATAIVTYPGVDRNGQPITREVTTNYTTVNTVLVKDVFTATQGGKLTTGNDSEASSYTRADTGQKTHIQSEEFVTTSRTTATAPSTAKAGSLNKEIKVTYDNGQTQNLGLVTSVTPSAPTITSDLHDKAGLTNQTITVSNVPEDGTVEVNLTANGTTIPNTTVRRVGSLAEVTVRGELPAGTIKASTKVTNNTYSYTEGSAKNIALTSPESDAQTSTYKLATKKIYTVKDDAANFTASDYVYWDKNGTKTALPQGTTVTWVHPVATTTAGEQNYQVTVRVPNQADTTLNVPVKVYDKVTLTKAAHSNAKGKLANGTDVANYVTGVTPGVTVAWQGGRVPDVSQANPNLKGNIEVSYATDDAANPIKRNLQVSLPTYSATQTVFTKETTVGTPFNSNSTYDYFTHDYPVPGNRVVKAFWESASNYHNASRNSAATTLGKVVDKIHVFFPNADGVQDYNENRVQELAVTFIVKPKTPSIDEASVSGKAEKSNQTVTINNVSPGTTVELYNGDIKLVL